MERLARNCIQSNRLFDLGINDTQFHRIFHYHHKNGAVSEINITKRNCYCSDFYDRAICKHIVAAFICADQKLSGMKSKGPTLRSRRRNLKPKAKRSLSADDRNQLMINEEVESIEFRALAVEPVRDETSKKRGRRPKNSKALETDDLPTKIIIPTIPIIPIDVVNTINSQIQQRRTSARLNKAASSTSIIIEKVVSKKLKK